MNNLEVIIRRISYKYLNEFTKDEKIVFGTILINPKPNYELNFNDKNTFTGR